MASRDSFISRWFNYIFIASCLFVFAYPAGRLSYWYFHNIGLSSLLAVVIWIGTIVLARYTFGSPRMKLRYLVVHWMGVSFIFASVTLFAEVVRLMVPVTGPATVMMVAIAALLCIVIAVLLSHHLAVKRLTISSPKIDRSYRVVQISDVHIGSRQKGFMQRIVNRINSLNPDFIVVTGDLIDSSAVDIGALESIRQLNAVTLFCIGNHERYADLEKVIDMADRLGMVTLREQTYDSEQLAFSGIDDADDVNQVALHLPRVPIDTDKFNVLLYHRPVGWEAAVEHGFDLMLSGHTHNGQIFPFNWVVKQQFRRIAGLYSEGNAHLYVSCGTGTWGPLMRLGSFNEVTLFNLVPEN